jgi:hypothetical protein
MMRFTAAEIEAGRKLFAADWQFTAAAGTAERLPPMKGVEIAFAGRSNVGKSSLINGLNRTQGAGAHFKHAGPHAGADLFRSGGRLAAAAHRYAGLRLRGSAEGDGRGVDCADPRLSFRPREPSARLCADRRAATG